MKNLHKIMTKTLILKMKTLIITFNFLKEKIKFKHRILEEIMTLINFYSIMTFCMFSLKFQKILSKK